MTEREYMESLRAIFRRHGVTRAVLFGSRARNSHASSSDFDVAVYGVANTVAIEMEIDDLPTLYSADVVNMRTCRNESLIKEIERHGVRL